MQEQKRKRKNKGERRNNGTDGKMQRKEKRKCKAGSKGRGWRKEDWFKKMISTLHEGAGNLLENRIDDIVATHLDYQLGTVPGRKVLQLSFH